MADRNTQTPKVGSEASEAVRMLCDVSAICSETDGIPSMGRRVLRRVCRFNGWVAGRIYLHEVGGVPLREVASFADRDAETPSRRAFRSVAECLLDRAVRDGHSTWATPEHAHDPARDLYTWVCAPIKVENRNIGAFVLASEQPAPDGAEIRGALESVAVQFGGVVRRNETARLLDSATRAERNRIGRDLHDTVAQDLAGLTLVSANAAMRLEGRRDPEAEVVRSVAERLTSAVEMTRSIVRGLLPVGLESGLADALCRLCEDIADTHETECVPEVEPVGLDADTALQLFLIAREALLNSVRHAGPSRVVVRLYEQGGDAVLEICDNGQGFAEAGAVTGGSGLTIIRHRATLVDGRVSIASEPGRGTTVRCVLPIEDES